LNLIAYTDESGIHDQAKSVVVAGWVSTKELWAEFTLQWESVLCEYGARKLHTHQLGRAARDKPGGLYTGWDDAKAERFLRDLIPVARDNVIFGLAASVSVKDYEEITKTKLGLDWGKPFYFAFEFFLRQLSGCVKREPLNSQFAAHERLLLIYGRQRDYRKQMEAAFDDLKDKRAIDHRIGDILISEDDNQVPLQAADLLAHSFYTMFDRKLAGKTVIEPGSLYEELNSKRNIFTPYCDRDILELEIDEGAKQNET
jgi:uncharacterized protein DUF3800